MTASTLEQSPKSYARIAGVLYLFIFIAALYGEDIARGTLIVWQDPAATAANIRGSETIFRLGIAGEMLTCVCDVALALILYLLLKPVNRTLALLGALERLAFVAIYSVSKLFEVAALVFLNDTSLTAFTPGQLENLAHAALRVHSLGYGASLLFFGACTSLFGYLIRKSGFFPKTIGILWEIAGPCYMLFSLAQIMAPAFTARHLFPWLILPAFPAELSLALYLAIKGVNLSKWHERASLNPATAM